MEKKRVGLLTFSDGRPEVHRDQLDIINEHREKIIRALEKTGEVEVVEAENIVTSARLAKEEAEKLAKQDICCTLFNIPIWAFPHFSVIAARNGKPPYLLIANDDPKTASMVGMLAAAGSLDQIGVYYRRVYGDIEKPEVLRRLWRL